MATVLRTLFADLEQYVQISDGVRAKSASVADISESLRVSALNGAIEADKLGTKAAGLRPVLDWLRSLSGNMTTAGAVFSGALNELVSEVELVVFDLMAAKLSPGTGCCVCMHDPVKRCAAHSGASSTCATGWSPSAHPRAV
jgi:hypothetical protein